MAGFFVSGTLLFVLMFGASYSNPIKKVSDSGYQGTGSMGNPGAGAYLPSGSGSWVTSNLGAPHGLTYSKPAAVRGPATSFGSGAAGVGPGYSGYPGSYPGGAVMQNSGPVASQDVEWLQAPPSPLSDMEGSEGDSGMAGSLGAGGSRPHGHDHGHGPHVHDAGPAGPSGLYQGGELSHMQNTFEHGNYDTETETQGVPSQRPGGGVGPGGPLTLPGSVVMDSAGGLSVAGPDYNTMYPFYDYLFLTGQYPPGTVSHFSSSFEQGKDFWHDAHYNKYMIPPGDADDQQVKAFPVVKQQI